MKNWWVVYKVNHKMYTHRYDEFMERHEDDDDIDVYQEDIEGHQNFTIYGGAGLTELDTCHIQLMDEEPGPSSTYHELQEPDRYKAGG
jgi:hypothetical protein